MKELMKELKDEELKDVNGGFSGLVDKYDAKKGRYYYAVRKANRNDWFYGYCLGSYEAHPDSCCTSVRTHDIWVKDSGSLTSASAFKYDKVVSISGDKWDLYENR